MKHYDIITASKNKKSLETFSWFFSNNSRSSFNTINRYFKKKKRKKVLTILKSPHVNKKAQEQFESKLFSKQLTLYLPKHHQYLLFLKKIKAIFSDIKIRIRFIHNKSLTKKKQVYVFNTQNFKLKLLDNSPYQNKNIQKQNNIDIKSNGGGSVLKQVKQYIKIADIYGELCKT